MADTIGVIGPQAGNGSEQTLYTVGATAGTRFVVQHVHIANTTGGDLTFKLSIGADAAGTRLFSDTTVPGNGGYLDMACWIPIAASGTLRWTAPAGLTISGGGVESVP